MPRVLEISSCTTYPEALYISITVQIIMAPTTMKQWVVESKEKDFDGLVYQDAPVPNVGENEVLVKLQAASLNYRDLIIPKVRRGQFKRHARDIY